MLRDASRDYLIAAQGSAGVSAISGRERLPGDNYTQDDIRNGFRADIRSHKLGTGDRLGMGLSVFLALALPMGVLLLLLLAVTVWLNSTFAALGDPGVETWWLGILVLGNVLLAGFVLATVRRLVLVGRHRKQFLVVDAQQQPELHALVNHVADLLGGPAPGAIKLDAEVGLALRPASWFQGLTGAGPEIVIGLPLLYGLSVRQLSGVIAHAYAGYTREARAHGYPLICSIDRWLFAQSGMARSAIAVDGQFSSLGRAGATWYRPVLHFFDFLSQATFFLLYRMVSAITFVASRRVDMIGDQFSARIAGSTEFRSTQFRLRSLYYGQQHANLELVKRWRNGKLSDNFPVLVVDHADALQLSLRPRLIQEMEELVTPMTRSRIVDLGRIVNVEQGQDEGACYLLGSAATLMRDMPELARKASIEHYHDMGISQPDLSPAVKNVLLPAADRERGYRADVFGGLERSGRFVCIEDFAAPGLADRQDEMAGLDEKLQQDSAVIWHLADTFRNFDNRKNLLHIRKVVEESQNADAAVVRDIELQWLALIKEQSEVKAELLQYERILAHKVAIAFAMAVTQPVIARTMGLDAAGFRTHLLRLSHALGCLNRSFESLLRLRTYTQILGQLLVCSAGETDARMKPVQERLMERYQKYVMVELGAVLGWVSPAIHPMMAHTLQTVDSLKSRVAKMEPPTIGDVIRIEISDLDSASTCPEACHRVASAVVQYVESLNEQLQDRVSLVVARVQAQLPTASRQER